MTRKILLSLMVLILVLGANGMINQKVEAAPLKAISGLTVTPSPVAVNAPIQFSFDFTELTGPEGAMCFYFSSSSSQYQAWFGAFPNTIDGASTTVYTKDQNVYNVCPTVSGYGSFYYYSADVSSTAFNEAIQVDTTVPGTIPTGAKIVAVRIYSGTDCTDEGDDGGADAPGGASCNLDYQSANKSFSVTAAPTATPTNTPPAITQAYLAPSAEDCAGYSNCYTVAQTALNALSDGGTLSLIETNVYDNSTVSLQSGNSGAKSVTINSVGGGTLRTGSASGAPLFEVGAGNVTIQGAYLECTGSAYAVRVNGAGNLTVKDTNFLNCAPAVRFEATASGTSAVKGSNLIATSAAAAFEVNGAGTIRAYANNIEGYSSAVSGTRGGTFTLDHNWWGTYADASRPANLTDAEWYARLGRQMHAWAEGNFGNTGATLGAARLTGGTAGKSVIISYGRFSYNAPFGNGILNYVNSMCSDYYDYFTVSGSGTYKVTLPVDNTTNCNANTLAYATLFYIPASTANDTGFDYCAANPTDYNCWQQVNSTNLPGISLAVSGQNIEISGLTSAQLGGTPMVAGSDTGTDPTAIDLIDLTGSSESPVSLPLLAAAAGVVLLIAGFLVIRRRNG